MPRQQKKMEPSKQTRKKISKRSKKKALRRGNPWEQCSSATAKKVMTKTEVQLAAALQARPHHSQETGGPSVDDDIVPSTETQDAHPKNGSTAADDSNSQDSTDKKHEVKLRNRRSAHKTKERERLRLVYLLQEVEGLDYRVADLQSTCEEQTAKNLECHVEKAALEYEVAEKDQVISELRKDLNDLKDTLRHLTYCNGKALEDSLQAFVPFPQTTPTADALGTNASHHANIHALECEKSDPQTSSEISPVTIRRDFADPRDSSQLELSQTRRKSKVSS